MTKKEILDKFDTYSEKCKNDSDGGRYLSLILPDCKKLHADDPQLLTEILRGWLNLLDVQNERFPPDMYFAMYVNSNLRLREFRPEIERMVNQIRGPRRPSESDHSASNRIMTKMAGERILAKFEENMQGS
jgi:hypothetical protein